MTEFKTVVSTPDGRAFQKEVEAPALVGTKIGQEIDGSLIGLSGYRLEITGGSDSEGFPMRADMPGTGRRKVLLTGGAGYTQEENGMRRRRSVRGNTVSDDTAQLNLKVLEEGDKTVPQMWELESAEPQPQEDTEEGNEDESTDDESGGDADSSQEETADEEDADDEAEDSGEDEEED